MKLSSAVFVLAGLFVLLAGCGPKITAVTGVVTYEGKPASDIGVIFQPHSDQVIVSEPGVATTDQQGRFELRSLSSDRRGIEPGVYKVSLCWIDPNRDPNPIEGVTVANPTPYPRIDIGYSEGKLLVTLPPEGGFECNIELTEPPES